MCSVKTILKNKFPWAIERQTAAEIIHARADSKKPNMGLTNWKNSPKGKIRKTDICIAKNYLNAQELDRLNRIVSMYLDYAELQATSGKIMYMKDWVEKLDAFLKFNQQEILQDTGKVTHEVAMSLAEKEFERYNVTQDQLFESDFDKVVKKLLGSNKNRKVM